MSDRIDFYEVRCGTPDDWDHVCLCKDKGVAETIASVYGAPCFIEHVEIIASVTMDIEDY